MAAQCVICSAGTERDILPGTYCCAFCGFYSSTFVGKINISSRIDEEARSRALRPTRVASFRRLVNDCVPLLPRGGTILDVGCAHGWFMSVAKEQGFRCTGIEPDDEMASRARREGHSVTVGFFPDAIAGDETFDAIAFNDVFEHLSDLNGVLNAVRAHLRSNGLVIISLPVSNGLIFRLSRIAAMIGFASPLARLWQQGLPSPHLSYFNATNLRVLLEHQGFKQELSRPLRALAIAGLYERITYDKATSRLMAPIYYCVALAISLIANFAPADTRYFIFRQGTYGTS
jgi:2-polyprenyl-3-methyl-5-hydroxy-6-metoxy-1,4-benzoquinol methylase